MQRGFQNETTAQRKEEHLVTSTICVFGQCLLDVNMTDVVEIRVQRAGYMYFYVLFPGFHPII